MNMKVVDNDKDEITVMDGDKEVRGWSYANEQERRVKMLFAREFVEGWYQRGGRPELAEICKELSQSFSSMEITAADRKAAKLK